MADAQVAGGGTELLPRGQSLVQRGAATELTATLLAALVAGCAPLVAGADGGWALAECDDAVRWGRLAGGTLSWAAGDAPTPESITDLRLFGAAGELHLWLTGAGAVRWRLRAEPAGEPLPPALAVTGAAPRVTEERCVDGKHTQYLVGTTIARTEPGWVELLETGRGMRLRLPWSGPLTELRLPLRLEWRLYLEYDAHGNLDVVDSRLAALADKDGRALPPTAEGAGA